ncbi:MAG: hypothetical protein HZA91_21050 [Verrucomicrobia bacterium]|nr:hypothetical protein [Verrucomicrobiota bacterium]
MCPFSSTGLAWAGIVAAIMLFFDRAGNAASPETRRDITSWLRGGAGDGQTAGWAGTFAAVLDDVFGGCGRSWRCFWRSSLAAMTAAVVVAVIWAALRPDEVAALMKQADFRQSILRVFLVATLLNCIPGFAVLLATRALIRRMDGSRSTTGAMCLLLAIAVFTAVIALGALLAFKAALVAVMMCIRPEEAALIRSGPAELWALARTEVFPLSAIPGYWPWGIWFYAALFAPALAWLYAAAGGILRLTGLGRRWAGVEANPLRILGFTAVGVASVIYWMPLVWQ